MTRILGISCFYHDSAAALIEDGKIIFAAQEERFTRIKHDSSFPSNCIKSILKNCEIDLKDINYVVYYEKPILKFERLLETYFSFAPKGFISFSKAMPLWLKEKLFQKNIILKELRKFNKNFDKNNLFFSEHHLSHAASAFYPSPFEKAIILTLDGVGEWATSTISLGEKNKVTILKEIKFPHSLGLLYSAFTYYLGFKVNSGEYKVMGLAPYGKPRFKKIIFDKLIQLKPDGSFRLNYKYFNFATGLTMINKKFENLFGFNVRNSEKEEINQFHMDVAASIQEVIEEVIMNIVSDIASNFKIKNLCLSGGVALNCVANGKIVKSNLFDNIWIQPASGDAGGSLGAALNLWYNELNKERKINRNDSMQGSFLGPSFTADEIKKELIKQNAVFEKLDETKIIEKTANLLANGKAIGWFQGRMEFGPRALGGRSIIADPRSETMQKNLNLKVKFRESFRPFAPSINMDYLTDWFDIKVQSPYMLLVSNVLEKHLLKIPENYSHLFGIEKLNIKRSIIPAVTHVDNSARIQTVHNETNPKYYNLIKKFNELTKCPILVNTSFNIRGEPIVCSVEDAFKCFMGTKLDALVIENFLLEKQKQNVQENLDFKNNFKLD